MTCGSCGATIADKAIVCYRCGAPTAAPAARQTPAAGRRRVRPATVGTGALAAGLGALTLLVPDGAAEIAAGAGAMAAALATGWLWLRR
jgi:hypothetical protein